MPVFELLELIGPLIPILIVVQVFRWIKRQTDAKSGQQGQPPSAAGPSRRTPDSPWAQVMGGSLGELLQRLDDVGKGGTSVPPPRPAPRASLPMPVQTLHREALTTTMPPREGYQGSLEGYASTEGMDDCHDYMITPPEQQADMAPAPRVLRGIPLRFDQNALLQGVVYAEILTRPALRRRPAR